MPTSIPQSDYTTVWDAVEDILHRLRDDEVLNPRYLDKSMHLDWWWEQPFFEGGNYALPDLCFYVESNVIELNNENAKRDRMRVAFNIYMEWRSNADSHVGALSKGSFLSFKPWALALHRALQHYKSDNMHSALRRTAGPVTIPEAERPGVLLMSTYQCLIYDNTASPERIFDIIKETSVGGSIIKPE